MVVSVSVSIRVTSETVGLLHGSLSVQIRAISMHLSICWQSTFNDSCHYKVQAYSNYESKHIYVTKSEVKINIFYFIDRMRFDYWTRFSITITTVISF